MRKISTVLPAVLLISAAMVSSAETWKVDPVHSFILFRIQHAGAGYARGAFTDFEGAIKWDPAAVEKSSVSITVKTASVNTFNEMRDEHLRSPDFFDVEKYPEMIFTSTSVKAVDKDTAEISGDLTMLGKTRPVTFKAEYTGEGKGNRGEDRCGFEAVFTIRRSEFGMTKYLPDLLSDEVELTINLEGVKEEAAES